MPAERRRTLDVILLSVMALSAALLAIDKPDPASSLYFLVCAFAVGGLAAILRGPSHRHRHADANLQKRRKD